MSDHWWQFSNFPERNPKGWQRKTAIRRKSKTASQSCIYAANDKPTACNFPPHKQCWHSLRRPIYHYSSLQHLKLNPSLHPANVRDPCTQEKRLSSNEWSRKPCIRSFGAFQFLGRLGRHEHRVWIKPSLIGVGGKRRSLIWKVRPEGVAIEPDLFVGIPDTLQFEALAFRVCCSFLLQILYSHR